MADEEDFSKLSEDELLQMLSEEQLRDIAGLKQQQQTLAPILGPAKQFGAGVVETLSPAISAPEAHMYMPEDQAEAAKSAPLFIKSMLPDPKGTVEEYFRAAGQGAPYGLLGPTGLEAGAVGVGKLAANALARSYAYGAGPAMTGKAASDVTNWAFPGAKVPLPAWLGGDVPASQAAGMLGSMRTGPFAGKITPFAQTDPARAVAAQTIKQETGRWPTAGQIFNDQAQKNRELRDRPGINTQQADDLTRAYTRRAGPQAEVGRIIKSPQNGQPGFFDEHFGRIGRDFDHLAANTFADPRIMGSGISNAQLYNDLTNIAGNARRNGRTQLVNDALDIFRGVNDKWVPTKGVAGNPTLFDEQLHDALFRNMSIPGTTGTTTPTAGRVNMTGEQYQRLRTALHSEAERSDPVKANFLRNIADALDTGVENTLRSIGSPLAGQWANTRGQYRAMLTLEDAAKRLPPGPVRLDPDVMQAADQNVSGTRPYLRGQTPFANLTEAAGTVQRPLERKEVPEPPSTLEKASTWIPGGHWLYRQGPKVAAATAGGLARMAGLPVGTSLEAGVLALLGAGGEGRWKQNLPSNRGTVGAGPVSQWYGRNQVMPMRPEDEIHRKLHAVSRALMLPQDQPNQ